MNKYLTLLLLLLAIACSKEQSRYGPVFSVDYHFDGESYYFEKERSFSDYKYLERKVCAAPHFRRREDTSGMPVGKQLSFSWQVYKPLALYIYVLSSTPFLEEGVKYYRDTTSSFSALECWVYYPENNVLYSHQHADMIPHLSWFEFYHSTTDGVAFEIKFDVALKCWTPNEEKKDTVHVDGTFHVYDRLMDYRLDRVLIE